MGLSDTIMTLEAQYEEGLDVGAALALALAEMISRKSSRRLVLSYFDDLAPVLKALGMYNELIQAAGGVDPYQLGAWDIQRAVEVWAGQQS